MCIRTKKRQEDNSDGVTGTMLRAAAVEAGVEDTGGTKDGVGCVCAGYVMMVFLLATAAEFVVLDLP